MLPIRPLHRLALGALISAMAIIVSPPGGEAVAQIRLKQTTTNFGPSISQRDIQRMRDEDRIRAQRIRERNAAQQRFAERNRRILEEQRVGRSILFNRNDSRPRRTGSSGVSR